MIVEAASKMPVTLESIEALSEARREPAWLRDLRREHLFSFAEAAPQFGRYSRLRLDWRELAVGSSQIGRPPRVAGMQEGPDARVWSPLSTAVRSMDKGVFAERFRAQGPWDRLVLAGWEEGHALSWMPGKVQPDVVHLPLACPGGLVLEPILLDVADRCEASLFVHWQGGSEQALHLSTVGGRVGQSARLKLFVLHDGGSAHRHLSIRLNLDRDASVDVFTAWVGGRWTVARYCGEMSEPGGSWKESHIVLGSGREHVDLDSQVRHVTQHTSSDVQVRTVASGASRTVFTGNILMEKNAELSQAYLADHVLLLSPEARADSIPGLEIQALDVKAAHAASVGQVDEDQLYYIQSRGMDPARARHLIVVGFLESLFDRAPFPMIPEVLDPILESRVIA